MISRPVSASSWRGQGVTGDRRLAPESDNLEPSKRTLPKSNTQGLP